MWNAIKGDLLEFVNVIQTDVVHTMETSTENTSNTPNSNSTSHEHLNTLGNNTVNKADIEKLGSSRETFTEVSSTMF